MKDIDFDALILRYRAHVATQRIRLREVFHDFDALRSGSMTISRFIRCISASMDKGMISPLNAREMDSLAAAFESNTQPGLVKWRDFIEVIDKGFEPKLMDGTHAISVSLPFRRKLSPESEEAVRETIAKLKSFVKHHGSDVKTWYVDFDKYNNGYVTTNQFRRAIPPNLLKADEEDLLIHRYGEPVNGTVNYFKLNTDVNRKVAKPNDVESQMTQKLSIDDERYDDLMPVGTEEILHRSIHTNKPSSEQVEEKVQKHVYKNRIRMIEFFRDYDRLNCGQVSEKQFLSILNLNQLPITQIEAGVLASKFLIGKDRVDYRNFCSTIENVFTQENLLQNPLLEVSLPSRSWLVQKSNELSKDDEIRCRQIIKRFEDIIRQKRMLVTPFFKDFDKSLGNMGRITRSHFSRLLSTMGLDITDSDLHIIFRKFEDRTEGKVNYMEFIRTVDPEPYSSSIGSIHEQEDNQVSVGKPAHIDDIAALIKRIQSHVEIKRIRVSEYFRDFDPLRKFSIKRSEFKRGFLCISTMFSPEELEALCDHYIDPKAENYCRWKDFDNDISSI